MESDVIKDLFLETVARAKKKYDFRIENFCILGNHFHMIIQPINGANLSSIMQWIMGVFAMKFNRIHKLSGHVWGSRFYSSLITTLAELVHAFKYIVNNPVKAGLIERPEAWKYSGLWHIRHGIRGLVDRLPHSVALLIGDRPQ